YKAGFKTRSGVFGNYKADLHFIRSQARVLGDDNNHTDTLSPIKEKAYSTYLSTSNLYLVIEWYFSSLLRITDGNVGWWTAFGKPCVSKQIPKCFFNGTPRIEPSSPNPFPE